MGGPQPSDRISGGSPWSPTSPMETPGWPTTLEIAVQMAPTDEAGRKRIRATGQRCHAARVTSLRQGWRRTLQSHLGAAQIASQQRPRRRRLLAGPHAGAGEDGFTSPGAHPALPQRTSAWRTLTPWAWPCKPRKPSTLRRPPGNSRLASGGDFVATAPKSARRGREGREAHFQEPVPLASREMAPPVGRERLPVRFCSIG